MLSAAPEKLHREAQRALQQNDFETADRCLGEALKHNPNDHVALALMAEARLGRHDLNEAFALYTRAINAAPHVPTYKKKFLELAARGLPMAYSDSLASALAACLKTPELASLLENWVSLVLADPHFRAAYRLSERQSFDPSNRSFFAGLTDFRPLFTPLFLEGLKSNIVCNPVFEEFITHIRRHLLNALGTRRGFSAEEHVLLACAVSHYAFFSDFILDVPEEEQKKSDALRRRVETEKDGARDAAAIAVLACYQPLHALRNAAEILENFKNSQPLAEVVNAQIADPLSLHELAASIPSVTDIEDRTSQDVRDQYESSPYPRWKNIAKERLLQDWEQDECSRRAEGPLRDTQARILVAGCGTGREAVMLGAIFPDAAILAIDLSRASLAYAELKAREHGVANIAFRQGDILKLGGLEDRFDYISSSGVLHHLEEPIEGWKVLGGLLKPRGLMRIGLYSQIGRKPVAAAQEAIRKGKYPSSREGILRFRREAPNICDRATLASLAGLKDYYHMNMYRDLLFHVRERSFDILQIEAILKKLDLSFEGFHVRPEIFAAYRDLFPNDPEGADLNRWRQFEQENQRAFASMYVFWCRKGHRG